MVTQKNKNNYIYTTTDILAIFNNFNEHGKDFKSLHDFLNMEWKIKKLEVLKNE